MHIHSQKAKIKKKSSRGMRDSTESLKIGKLNLFVIVFLKYF